jgi:hypothetical protein
MNKRYEKRKTFFLVKTAMMHYPSDNKDVVLAFKAIAHLWGFGENKVLIIRGHRWWFVM